VTPRSASRRWPSIDISTWAERLEIGGDGGLGNKSLQLIARPYR
jgi:hypothetical protein